MKIFWVEDSKDLVDMVGLIVKMFAEDVVLEVAGDVRTGHARLADRLSQGQHPDIVLLDMRLPDGSGLDVHAALADDLRLAGIPAAVLTSSTDAPDRAATERAGLPFFTKPIAPNDWMALVDQLRGLTTMP